MAGIAIRPLLTGAVVRDKSVFTYLRNIGQTVRLPVISWYIEGADASILVDTAAPSPAESPAYAQPYEQSPEQQMEAVLASIGVRPEEVEIVILTHLHWDHCTNAHLFPKARFVIQRAELRYAVAPLPVHYGPYGAMPPGTRAFLPADAQITVVEGDRQIVRGVSVVHLPGHTPGLQAVRVDTGSGVYLIASDNVPFYENWQGEPPMVPHIPSSLHVSLEDYFASFGRMEQIADVVLPSHDFRVLEKGRYPE